MWHWGLRGGSDGNCEEEICECVVFSFLLHGRSGICSLLLCVHYGGSGSHGGGIGIGSHDDAGQWVCDGYSFVVGIGFAREEI